jgi:hypothetical protein
VATQNRLHVIVAAVAGRGAKDLRRGAQFLVAYANTDERSAHFFDMAVKNIAIPKNGQATAQSPAKVANH